MKKFIPPHPLNTPVLFLVFNRPDTTRQVFEAIRLARPPRLYVAADGPRAEHPEETEKVREVRHLVLSNIDWDCEVKTLFREKNLGCKYAVSGAITWFFKNEEQGIILEDDTLPSQSFFWFCEALLERYRDDERIFSISASHFQDLDKNSLKDSYYLSKYSVMWGWATWKQRWQKYSLDIDDYFTIILRERYFSLQEKLYWLSIFRKLKADKIDTWDYQWLLACWKNKGYALRPTVNLSRNIGFRADATHTSKVDSPMAFLELYEIDMACLRHPAVVSYERNNDILAVKVWANIRFKSIILLNFPLVKLKKYIQGLLPRGRGAN